MMAWKIVKSIALVESPLTLIVAILHFPEKPPLPDGGKLRQYSVRER
jgi:hypothetical protein